MAMIQARLVDSSAAAAGGPRSDVERRALAMWPRLDRRALRRCGGDAGRVARLVARRTSLDPEVIRMILEGGVDLERELWFG